MEGAMPVAQAGKFRHGGGASLGAGGGTAALSVSVLSLQSLTDALRRGGIAVDPVLESCGLGTGLGAAVWERVGSDRISDLWRALDRQGDGVKAGLCGLMLPDPGAFCDINHAMMCSPDLRQALRLAGRYCSLASTALSIDVLEEGDDLAAVVDMQDSTGMVPLSRTLFFVATMVSFLRWAAARTLVPLAVEFRGHPAEGAAVIRAGFACPVRFGAGRDAVILAGADVERPMPMANPVLLAFLKQRLAAQHAESGARPIAAAVRHILAYSFHRGGPVRDRVAAAAGMSLRTLQRRLAREGTTFQQVLDEARRDFARVALANPDLAVKRIPDQLGYSGLRPFGRACRRWFGQTPTQIRRAALGQIG